MERTGSRSPVSAWIVSRSSRRAAKWGRDFSGSSGVGSDGHQAVERQPRQGVERLGQDAGRSGRAAELGAFARDVDLEKDVLDLAHGFGAAVQLLRQLDPVDRIDEVEEPDRVLRLVGLEMADEVPDAAAHLLDLAARLLHLVFPEAHDARAHRLADRLGRLCLAHRHQFDFGRVAARAAGGRGDRLLQAGEAGGKIVHQTNLSSNRAKAASWKGIDLALGLLITISVQVESFKVFRDLVESRSFSKAASLNLVTQSAVSQQVRAMEERFLVPLIERSNKRFGLTREGQMLYEASKQIVYQFDSLQHQLSEIRNVVSGTIRLSTVYSIGLHELPPYLKKFLKEFPGVHVHVEYRRSNQVYEEVGEGTSDLGLVAFPVQKKALKVEAFRKDRLVLICVPGHELARQEEIVVEKLRKEKFIGFEPDIPTRKAVDKIFREAGIEVNPVMEFDNIETVKRGGRDRRGRLHRAARDGGAGGPRRDPGRGRVHRPALLPAARDYLQGGPRSFPGDEAVPQDAEGIARNGSGRQTGMKWFLFAFVGVMLNGAGLAFLGEAIIHRATEPGRSTPGSGTASWRSS